MHRPFTRLMLSGLCAAMLLLSACGSNNAGGNTSNACASTRTIDGKNLVVGGKLDPEAQLLTKMYTLLLRKAGFTVTEKAKLGTNTIVFSAICSGQIDVYPEFTATGLGKLGDTTSHNAQQDYQTVKTAYESKYHLTWLDVAPMNDTYGICTTQAVAQKYNLTKMSDLIAVAKNLKVATPPDGQTDPGALTLWKSAAGYGLNFKKEDVLDEAVTFTSVQNGQDDLNVCYTTIGFISADNFVLLQDDKSVTPAYNPAPLIRQDTLAKSPNIATALNPLAPLLTTAAITKLNAAVANGGSITDVATQFLQQQGLI